MHRSVPEHSSLKKERTAEMTWVKPWICRQGTRGSESLCLAHSHRHETWAQNLSVFLAAVLVHISMSRTTHVSVNVSVSIQKAGWDLPISKTGWVGNHGFISAWLVFPFSVSLFCSSTCSCAVSRWGIMHMRTRVPSSLLWPSVSTSTSKGTSVLEMIPLTLIQKWRLVMFFKKLELLFFNSLIYT